MKIRVIDDFLATACLFREAALRLDYTSRTVGPDIFHGVASSGLVLTVTNELERIIPEASTALSFFRKSSLGQIEPNDIHSDAGMGDWTGILYLNPKPDSEDGTVFWQHKITGMQGSIHADEWKADGHDRTKWDEVCRVPAKFNRLLLFAAPLYHSRAIVENYGEGDDARLIQVIFGKGQIPWQ